MSGWKYGEVWLDDYDIFINIIKSNVWTERKEDKE